MASYLRILVTNPIINAINASNQTVSALLQQNINQILAAIAADPGNTINLSDEQVTELAGLIVNQLPQPPSAAEIAEAVADEDHARSAG